MLSHELSPAASATPAMTVTPTTVDQVGFDYLRSIVAQRSAIVLEPHKGYFLESRLLPLARRLGLASVGELISNLRRSPNDELLCEVIEALTTHETSFFRDLSPFRALRNTLLPRLIAARGASRTLRIWCAACSSGQEPYTIALVLKEYFPQLAGWNVLIHATDLSQQILDRARRASFNPTEIVRGMPGELLQKYFDRQGDQWRLREDVREMVRFSRLNLIEPWPAQAAMDVVFIRNVLIYFAQETKCEILERTGRVLAEDGYLFLGGAETIRGVESTFCKRMIEGAPCYQRVR